MMTPKKAKQAAQRLKDNPELIAQLLQKAFAKTQRYPNFLENTRKDWRLLLRMTKAQVKGTYKLPWKTAVIGIAAIIYFVNPLDLIPDFIIGAGLIDDATVLTLAFKALHAELMQFNEWESKQDPKSNVE